MSSFSSVEPVHCSMSSPNCCFLTCLQVSQETDGWSRIPFSLRIFQFIVIHTVKGFSIVNETEVDVFLEFPCFFFDPMDVGNFISGSSAFFRFPWWLRYLLQCWRPRFSLWVGKITWRREWQRSSVFLPGESHAQRSLLGYSLGL